MAPHKCNYIIFSKFHGDESSKLHLELFKTKLEINNSPTFLGIRFDKALTFKNQIDYLQDSCVNRLNFLKIVSKRSYGLSLRTLNQLYVTLIRSILEYLVILYPVVRKTSFKRLNIIQNKSIKIINRKSIYCSSNELITEIEALNERFDHLNIKYLINSIKRENELICELWNDLKGIISNRQQNQKTILCSYKEDLLLLLT
jgi:hypothetical protein